MLNKFIYFSLGVVVLVLVIFSVVYPVAIFAQNKKLEFSVWVPYWKKTLAVEETIANLDKLSVVTPFSYEVAEDGTLKDVMKIAEKPWPELLNSAKEKKVKIIPSIHWSNGEAINNVLSQSSEREKHIQNILAEIKKYNYDGIEIDYENKKAETIDNFSLFIKDLSLALDGQKKTLVCAIEPRLPLTARFLKVPEKIEYANDYVQINKYCDEVRLMAYNQLTSDIKLNLLKRRGGLYSPIADSDWVKKIIVYASHEIDRNKMVLGVANYGYEYEIKDNRLFFDYKTLRSLGYTEALKIAQEVGATPARNSAGELSFVYLKDGQMRLVWFPDAQSIADKIKIARQYNLKGVSLFRVDGESDPNLWQVFK